jgi:hypothetical protein
MFRVFLGLLTAAVLLTPGEAYAQRPYSCVDDKAAANVAQGVLPGCASQQIPVVSNKPATPQELEGTTRYLEAQLATEGSREWRCNADREHISETKDDALDAVDALSDNRRNGRVSRAETRATRKIERYSASDLARAEQCIAQAQARAAEIRATLSDPVKLTALVPEWRAEQQREKVEQEHRLATLRAAEEKRLAAEEKRLADERAQRKAEKIAEKIEAERRLAALRAAEEKRLADERAGDQARERRREAAVRAEQERQAAAERLSQELREQWLALLENARGTHEIFASGAPKEDISLRLEAMGKQFQSIRVKYARQLQMGDHKTLGMAVYTAYAALTAANPDWQKERQAASDLAGMQATVERYRSIRRPSAMDRANADESMRRLQDVQQEYEQAKAQLAAKRDSVARLISEAVRVAKEEPEQARQVSGQAPSGGKLLSLDFKDADVVNLLRILAAESGRNMVMGDDVQGKVSVSVHNVTWEQALDAILEARGLQRLDRNGIIHIVTTH